MTLGLPGVEFVPRDTARAKKKRDEGVDDDSDNQHTPQWFLDLVARLWPEGIDTDPCHAAGCLVKARITYDGSCPEQDGKAQAWSGRTFCNPPYSNPTPWADRCAAHAAAGGEVLLLVNVTTTVKWWRRWRPASGRARKPERRDAALLAKAGSPGVRASAVAFFDKRIGFLKNGVMRGQNAYEQKLLYWGPRGAEFKRIFSAVAWVP